VLGIPYTLSQARHFTSGKSSLAYQLNINHSHQKDRDTMLTVKDLKEALQFFPDSYPVIVKRTDGQFSIIDGLDTAPTHLDANGQIIVEDEDDTFRDVANSQRVVVI
jgi:hypothetical protein